MESMQKGPCECIAARKRLEDAAADAEAIWQAAGRREEGAALADWDVALEALEAFEACDACKEENFFLQARSMSVVLAYATLQEAYDAGDALGEPFDISEASGAIVWAWEMRHA